MGEMLPDFLVVPGASTASTRLPLDANDHLRDYYEQVLSMEAPRPTTSAPPTQLGEQPLPPLTDTPLQETKLLHNFLNPDPSHRFYPHLFSLLLVTALMRN